MSRKFWLAMMTALLLSGALGNCMADEIAIKNGESLAFMGDSITQFGWQSPTGYVRLVINGLESCGVKVTPCPAGISGHKSNQMLGRLQKDVLDKKPAWMTLSCGVNDVWHGEKGVPLEQYQKNITAIIDKCQAAGVKVMILTATMIKEDAQNDLNKKLAAYNDFLRQLAKEKKCLLADLNADMQAAIKQAEAASKKPGTLLTNDGVHMNAEGNKMMASGILKAFGLSDAQLKKAKEDWLDMPGGVEVKLGLSLRQQAKLNEMAAKENKSVQDLLNAEWGKTINALVKNTSAENASGAK